MPSPFPGMDPYIEQPALWSDFHSDLAAEIRAWLNQAIQPRYFARLTPYVTFETLTIGDMQAMRPDVSVSEAEPLRPTRVLPASVSERPASAAVSPSVLSAVEVETPLRLNRVEIFSAAEEQLVTVIEILSPVNKRPGHEAHDDYLHKRRAILRMAEVHLVEIDLLRGGKRPPLAKPVPSASYYVMVSRSDRRPQVEVWPIQLSELLPILPIPLRAPDADVTLALGAIVATVYERAAYALQIDYTQAPPPPPLTAGEQAWLDQRLASLRSQIRHRGLGLHEGEAEYKVEG